MTLTWDDARKVITWTGTDLRLTPSETGLVALLAATPGALVTYADISTRLGAVAASTLRKKVFRIREKVSEVFGPGFWSVQTVTGVGLLWAGGLRKVIPHVAGRPMALTAAEALAYADLQELVQIGTGRAGEDGTGATVRLFTAEGGLWSILAFPDDGRGVVLMGSGNGWAEVA